ncbi:MAG: hypothetical protein ACREQ5_07730 [Candidatus Dormibacteria bacterium]
MPHPIDDWLRAQSLSRPAPCRTSPRRGTPAYAGDQFPLLTDIPATGPPPLASSP